MRLQLKGKNVDVSPGLEKLVEARLAKLKRRLDHRLVSAQLVLAKEKNRFVAELTVHARGDHMLHGIGNTAGWSTSLTAAVQKVLQQADTMKGKLEARKRPAKK